ncbi:hypothetical protein DV737_g1162, partial [Chaetothyriales sp. CBS 132003]
MCGRYALGIRAAFVRHQLQQQGLQVDDAPADDEARETYNFAPASYGLVYRADVPDQGLRDEQEPSEADAPPPSQPKEFHYQLKVMKWGLIPFWTKRSPDYGSMLRTINCRDDSLLENKGMWTVMKQKKRCLVIAQGFYEWLKKGPGGKERIPYFVRRKDGNLMCFAGLWDCVKYEDANDKLYTYTIITTDSNKQLGFLHDRMPVIIDPGTDAIKIWLDPTRNKWSKELQSLLKPYEGELECYPVSRDVGKVGNNSPDFIVPINSKENKNNIANFFGNAKAKSEKAHNAHEDRAKRQAMDSEASDLLKPGQSSQKRARDEEEEEPKDTKLAKKDPDPPKAASPAKLRATKKAKSATSNKASTLKQSPKKKQESGMQRIDSFFVK